MNALLFRVVRQNSWTLVLLANMVVVAIRALSSQNLLFVLTVGLIVLSSNLTALPLQTDYGFSLSGRSLTWVVGAPLVVQSLIAAICLVPSIAIPVEASDLSVVALLVGATSLALVSQFAYTAGMLRVGKSLGLCLQGSVVLASFMFGVWPAPWWFSSMILCGVGLAVGVVGYCLIGSLPISAIWRV